MFATVINTLNDWLYTYILIILLIAAGVYFTFRTRFVQFRMFAESIRVVGEKPHNAGSISSFQALMVSTASRVGTGNIIGISTAICCGGYGAVFWMWVMALLGMMTSFAENVLGVYYRRKNEKGEWSGGAMYYLTDGLGAKPGCRAVGKVLAVLFALAVVWISRQGGWKGEGCGGNCSSCHQHCDTPEKKH